MSAAPRRGSVYRVAMCRWCDCEIHTADTVDGSWSHVGGDVECDPA